MPVSIHIEIYVFHKRIRCMQRGRDGIVARNIERYKVTHRRVIPTISIVQGVITTVIDNILHQEIRFTAHRNQGAFSNGSYRTEFHRTVGDKFIHRLKIRVNVRTNGRIFPQRNHRIGIPSTVLVQLQMHTGKPNVALYRLNPNPIAVFRHAIEIRLIRTCTNPYNIVVRYFIPFRKIIVAFREIQNPAASLRKRFHCFDNRFTVRRFKHWIARPIFSRLIIGHNRCHVCIIQVLRPIES